MTDGDREPQLVASFDGTVIAAHQLGGGDARPLLIVDAIGTKFTPFRSLVAATAGTRPIFNWDLRGLFASGPVGRGGLDAGAHARDAIAVLDDFGIDDCVVVTWSSGGRIALEVAAAYPDRVSGLVLVCAGYGHAFARLLKGEPAVLLPRIAGIAKYLAPLMQDRFRRFVARPEIAGLVRQSGMTGATANTSSLVEMLRSVAGCDPRILLETYESVSGDPASALLPKVKARTMIAAGEFDQFTSQEVVREMSMDIPDSVVEVFDDATHFLPIEYPEELTRAIVRFLARLEDA